MGTLRLMAVGMGLLTSAAAGQEPPALGSEKERSSYALGVDYGNVLRKQSFEVDPEAFRKGMADALSGSPKLMTEKELQAAIVALRSAVKKKAFEARQGPPAADQGLSERNRREGQAFLASNAKEKGVVTTSTGLQYKAVRMGSGPRPTVADTVVCHVQGSAIGGKTFTDTRERGRPAVFPVGSVIKGWAEALQLMPVGSHWQLVIPPDLAYGARGSGQEVGPDATLLLDVELLSIDPRR